jgi:hypothetical protein
MKTATIRSQATIVSGRPARNLVLDNLASGTTEMGADLALADALDLNSVEPFTSETVIRIFSPTFQTAEMLL